MRLTKLFIAFILLLMLLYGGTMGKKALAANIDPDNDGSQYSYGENAGWFNFKPSAGPGVTVADAFLTGYVWAENIGWVSLSCLNSANCNIVNYGVTNDGNGNLSGYAWSENAGWINFNPGGGGITINTATGVFSGYAWGENIGWINFSPGTGGAVKTSWSPMVLVNLLSVSKAGVGTGTVTSSPTGIACGADCSEIYGTGEVVTLTATPDAGYIFTGWSGACTGTSPTCTVTMNGTRLVGAAFNPQFYIVFPPVLDPIGAKSVNEGAWLTFTVSGGDQDGDVLTYSAAGLPSGAVFDAGSRTFSWIPTYTQAGVYNVTFSVSDGSSSDSEIVMITVNDVPQEVCDGIDNDGDNQIDEGFPAGNTPCGTNVDVAPNGVVFNFPTVTMRGETTVSTSSAGATPPSGFKLGATPTYYEITSTAAFTGTVEVCFTYSEGEFATEQYVKLFHWENNGWKDITVSLDTVANVICGNTESFSPFILAEPSSTSSSSPTPTIVSGVSLSARMDGDRVVLIWSTGSERGNEGFIIQRAESAGGPFSPVTSAIIPATGGFGVRATYTFTDSSVEPGKTYYYRLQDIDSRGTITAHQIIPVTVAVATGDKGAQEVTGKGDVAASAAQHTKAEGNKETTEGGYEQPEKSNTWVSMIGVNVPLAPSTSPETGLPLSWMEDEDEEENLVEVPPTPTLPHKGGGSDIQPYVAATGAVSPNPGHSSFSVSIEDDKGNIIVVRRVEDTKDTVSSSEATGDLEVTKGSGSVTLTWKGKGGVKGFILHRAEKGKENYSAITGLIPYFGRDDKDVFLYKFTDAGIKPEVRYDYRLEVIKSDQVDRTALH